MSSVQELLRQNDPLARESGPTSSARARVREVVVRAGQGAPVLSRPRRWILRDGLALAGLVVAGALAAVVGDAGLRLRPDDAHLRRGHGLAPLPGVGRGGFRSRGSRRRDTAG